MGIDAGRLRFRKPNNPNDGQIQEAIDTSDTASNNMKEQIIMNNMQTPKKKEKPQRRQDKEQISPVGVEQVPYDDRFTTKSKNLDHNEINNNSSSAATKTKQKKKKSSKVPFRDTVQLLKPPSAWESAFGGPPRYDWIDIESSAAIKVQSVYRRNKVMKQLEEEGRTTAAIRNRSRRIKARMNNRGWSGGADIPSIFACCGVGLAFGDSTEENYVTARQQEKDRYESAKKKREAKEAELRNKYKQSLKTKVKANAVEESYEIVE